MLSPSGGFSADVEGKSVLTQDGDVVGEVVRTSNGTAWIRPRPELVAGYGSRLTSCWDPAALFELDESAVTTDHDGQLRIKPGERATTGELTRG
ncbi:MAG: hypothetical protein ACOCSD_00935 [Halolamina sp.]